MATVTFRTPKNNAYSTLDGSITNVATSISVASGEGARFPASDFWATIFNDDPNTNEIVLCSSRSTDTLTVTRAQQSTSGVAWPSGANIQMLVTAQQITDIQNALTDATDEINPGAVTVGSSSVSGVLSIKGLSTAGDEGAQIDMEGRGTNPDFTIDTRTNRLRLFSSFGTSVQVELSNPGAGDMTLAVLGDVTVSGELQVATKTPSSAADTGVAGTIAWDASYIYVCTATNTWKRVAIATWP
jgi:hypothetical protein